MSNNPIYQLDLAALRGYCPPLADEFTIPDVTLGGLPYWSNIHETLMVRVENEHCVSYTYVPCDWLTPNPAPTFRFITTVNGHVTGDITVQGIPVEYANYAPILLRDGFEWAGVNLGSQRVSIERVENSPTGETVPDGE